MHVPTTGGRDQRGAAAVEFLMIAPLLMLLTLLTVQWAVRLEAQRAVDAAAREGAVAAARWDGDAAQGRSTALDYLAALVPQLTGPSAQVVRDAREARATVRGEVISLIPGVELTVTSTATAPVERFVE